MSQITIDVKGVVTGVRIDAVGQRLILEGVLQATADGQTVKSFSEDVTNSLTDTQKQRVADIVAKAQSWIDGKLV